ncbi:MAG: hypothetical protein EOM48_03370 [Bacilli bacterium]|nr:hypothetical protein [Bacilli bacterium]
MSTNARYLKFDTMQYSHVCMEELLVGKGYSLLYYRMIKGLLEAVTTFIFKTRLARQHYLFIA